jgi:hypothetical protein
VDTNILVTPFNEYYSFDFGTIFWDFLEDNIINDNVIIINKVYHETIHLGKTKLTDWIKKMRRKVVDHATNHEISNNYNCIIDYLSGSHTLYYPGAVTNWSRINVADGWLIATSMALGYDIVTFEKPFEFLGKKQTTNQKIPDVACHFNIKCINLFDMMRALKFNFNTNYNKP